ncbi:cupin domain-containing protein [Pseudozobellia sp. WGM2]|uniref:cupin domain-containing protein n=1 Tax=Pseudozobellia sp. WGM2 TaxID=2787625 RepID=UPI001ADFA2DF|nr:cupin domain-containing protein [Pseudozobellia sp. WGM2]
MDKKYTSWKPIILQADEGEKILFRIGLMTFKVSSNQSDNNFMICETELPPKAFVEPHSHPEAETFYILEGEFSFCVDDMNKEIKCSKGSFISVPPFIKHCFKNIGSNKGKILRTITPGGSNGLESLFKTLGVRLKDNADIPDLNKPIENWIRAVDTLRENKDNNSNG